MAALTIQDGSAGIANVSLSAAAGGGDTVAAGSRGAGWGLEVVLVVRNGDATATTVTADGHSPLSVPAAGTALLPIYRTAFGTVVAVTYSKVTSLTVGAVRLSPAP